MRIGDESAYGRKRPVKIADIEPTECPLLEKADVLDSTQKYCLPNVRYQLKSGHWATIKLNDR